MPQFVMTAITEMLFGRIAARVPLHTLMVAGYGAIGAMLAMMVGFGAGTARCVSGRDGARVFDRGVVFRNPEYGDCGDAGRAA
ncbi:hypothetical protein [Burkholderia sp. BCC1999]|uniref:hypothetical protein n=1 Tax=Burkholderia sp. BCC1999 TaxID=2817448 RepID=UPI002AC36CFF|nr:hypothetical protein [Burkholderia sp. BCC1999]